MRFFKCHRLAGSPGDPTVMFAETDEQGWETRKVNVFRDGSMVRAGEGEESEGAWLASAPWPPVDEINGDPQFAAVAISQAEFEAFWWDAAPDRD